MPKSKSKVSKPVVSVATRRARKQRIRAFVDSYRLKWAPDRKPYTYEVDKLGKAIFSYGYNSALEDISAQLETASKIEVLEAGEVVQEYTPTPKETAVRPAVQRRVKSLLYPGYDTSYKTGTSTSAKIVELTSSETKLARMYIAGMSNSDIAERLSIYQRVNVGVKAKLQSLALKLSVAENDLLSKLRTMGLKPYKRRF